MLSGNYSPREKRVIQIMVILLPVITTLPPIAPEAIRLQAVVLLQVAVVVPLVREVYPGPQEVVEIN